MNERHSPNLLKVFIAGFLAMVIILAAFGVGVSVGAVRTHQALAASSPAETVSAAVCVEQAPPEQAKAPEPPVVEAGAQAPTATATPQLKSPTPAPRSDSTGQAEARSDVAGSPLDVEFFNEAWKLLQEQYYGDLPEGMDVTYAAIEGILAALDDEHTSFMDPEQAVRYREEMQGEFEGIGARVSEAEQGGVKIEYLFPEQPAEKAGVKVGDIVVEVDSKDVTKMSLNDAISLIRGPRGTKVLLSIEREGEEQPLAIEIVRARIEIKLVDTKTVGDGKIEYISLAEFAAPSTNRMAEAVRAAVAKKPQGIILDLRGNPGGLLDASVRIGSFFVPEGNIVIERFADGEEHVYERTGRYLLNDIPLVVLVNKGSASASEIVAGAIQDAGVGTLIGETTWGKGSVQLPNSMSDGSQLTITIARWFTPKDRTIDGTGLEPDIIVPATQEDADAGRDPQLDRAVEFLLSGK